MTVESASFLSDLNSSLPDGSNSKSEGDNHMRLIKAVLQATFPNFAGRFKRIQTKVANYTMVPNDSGSIIMFTAGSSLLGDAGSAAATLGNGWHIGIYANGVSITVDPNGVETVNGAASAVVPNGTFALLYCDGAAFHLFSAKKPVGVVGISGNITLTATDLDSFKNVTAAADITLPAVSVGAIGQAIRFKSSTGGLVRLLRQGADTIDGTTAYTLPSGGTVEAMISAAGTWILSIKPANDLGNIAQHGAGTAPTWWLLCDGSAVSRSTFSGLFAAIGTAFGAGDGSTTFNLPDFRRRVPVGSGGSGTGTLGASVGNSGGEETHALSAAEGPTHSHGVSDPGHAHTFSSGTNAGNIVAQSGPDLQGATPLGISTDTATTGISTQNAGSGTAHNIMQPSLVVAYIIKY